VRAHRIALGYNYGDFDAHDCLWRKVKQTKRDIIARVALVRRTLEAHGLDAAPRMQAKLAKVGDAHGVAVGRTLPFRRLNIPQFDL